MNESDEIKSFEEKSPSPQLATEKSAFFNSQDFVSQKEMLHHTSAWKR